MAATEFQIVGLRQKNIETRATKIAFFAFCGWERRFFCGVRAHFFKTAPRNGYAPTVRGHLHGRGTAGLLPLLAPASLCLKAESCLETCSESGLAVAACNEFFGEEVVLHCAIRQQGMTQILLPSCSEFVAYSEEKIIFKKSIIPRCSINRSSFYHPHMGWCKLQSLCNRF